VAQCSKAWMRLMNPREERDVRCTTSYTSLPVNADSRMALKLTTARQREIVGMLPKSRYVKGTAALPWSRCLMMLAARMQAPEEMPVPT
jgi:hypothetical protein